MANARLASWLAVSASLLAAPASGSAQLAPVTIPVGGPIPVTMEPIVIDEPAWIPGGTTVVPWAGPSIVPGPVLLPSSAPSPSESDIRARRRGDLLWQTLRNRGWQALRAIVPDEATRDRNLEIAESLFRAALERLQPYQPGDDRVAANYTDLAWVFYLRERYDEALPLARWALADRQARLGPYAPKVGDGLILLARIAVAQERYDEAESLAQRALDAYTRSSPGRLRDLHTPIALETLGQIASAQSRLDIAEAFLFRAFNWWNELYEFSYDLPEDKYAQVTVELARSNFLLADVLKKLGRTESAEILEQEGRALLQSATLGPAPAGPSAAGGGAAPGPPL